MSHIVPTKYHTRALTGFRSEPGCGLREGALTAIYDQAGLHFHLSDPLGTRRVQLSGNLTSGNLTSSNLTSSGQPLPLGQAELDCLPSQPPDCSGLPSTRSLGSTLVFRRHFAQNYPLLAQDGSMRIFSSNSSPEQAAKNSSPERASNLPRSLPRKNDPPFCVPFVRLFPITKLLSITYKSNCAL